MEWRDAPIDLGEGFGVEEEVRANRFDINSHRFLPRSFLALPAVGLDDLVGLPARSGCCSGGPPAQYRCDRCG